MTLRSLSTRLATVAVLAAALVAPGAPAASQASSGTATSDQATLIDLRTAHHAGYDRLTLVFDQAQPPRATVSAVHELIGDFSGRKVPVPGRAILRVVLRDAAAHTSGGDATLNLDQTFALPNVMALRGAGDFEGVLTLGVGLARSMPFRVHRLTDPGRIAIDVSTRFARTARKVYFVAPNASGAPVRRGVTRSIPDAYPATGLLDRLFAGPTNDEQARGLRFVSSGAAGFRSVRVADRVARVRLTGQCRAAGSQLTVADQILPTLRRLASVRWVKVYDPSGNTTHPRGHRDSVPSCLLPSAGTCLYLVKDLQHRGDLYTGGFLVAHLQDGSLLGSAGQFYSEWSSVRGQVTASGASLEIQGEDGSWRAWPQTWLPDSSTFQGWTPVTKSQLRTYSGGGVPIAGQPCG